MMDVKKILIAALCALPVVAFSMDQDGVPDDDLIMGLHQPAATEQSIRKDLEDAKQGCGTQLHNFLSFRGADINAVDPTGALFDEIFREVQLALTQNCPVHNEYIAQ